MLVMRFWFPHISACDSHDDFCLPVLVLQLGARKWQKITAYKVDRTDGIRIDWILSLRVD